MTTVDDFRQRCQARLPEGVRIDRDLGGAEEHGYVFRVLDGRADSGTPIARVARILEDPDGSAQWREPLRERALKLLGISLPYVSTLREAGGFSGPAVYLLHDEHPISLDCKISADEGLPPEAVKQIVERLLIGLAALHQRGIAHGDLRLSNIFLSESPACGRFPGNVWIGDVATGGLSFWSEGRFVPALPKAFPPEWGVKPGAPGSKADLYALGVLISQALVGRSVIDSPYETTEQDQPSYDKLAARLEKRNIPAPELLFLAKRLLASEDNRPADATAVQKEIGDRRRLNRWLRWIAAGATALIIVGALAAALLASRYKLDAQAVRISDLETTKHRLDADNRNLIDKNTRLENQLAKGQPTSSEEQARRLWENTIQGSTTYPEDFKKLAQKIAGLPLADPRRGWLVGWYKEYKLLYYAAKPALDPRTAVNAILTRFSEAPWDFSRQSALDAVLNDKSFPARATGS
jgi:serine/threonine protein kinase